MISRRTALLAPVAGLAPGVATRAIAATGKMTLCIHQTTTSGAGYRGSLERWAKTGIKHVELSDALLDAFLRTGILTAAGQVLKDLGLTRELLDNSSRFIRGNGVSPLVRILRKLAKKGSAGSLAVELFLPELQNGGPFESAKKIREKSEAVLRTAWVI